MWSDEKLFVNDKIFWVDSVDTMILFLINKIYNKK